MSEEDQNEFIGTPEFREWVIGLLNDNNRTTKVTFTKKDGTVRTMRCTRNPTAIPEEFHPKTTDSSTTGAIRAFDLDKNEWRSFLPENITRIDYAF